MKITKTVSGDETKVILETEPPLSSEVLRETGRTWKFRDLNLETKEGRLIVSGAAVSVADKTLFDVLEGELTKAEKAIQFTKEQDEHNRVTFLKQFAQRTGRPFSE